MPSPRILEDEAMSEYYQYVLSGINRPEGRADPKTYLFLRARGASPEDIEKMTLAGKFEDPTGGFDRGAAYGRSAEAGASYAEYENPRSGQLQRIFRLLESRFPDEQWEKRR